MHMYPLFLSLSLSTRRRTQLARAGAPCAKCSCAHARQQLWLTHVYVTWRVTPFWIPDGDIDVITVLPLQTGPSYMVTTRGIVGLGDLEEK